MSTEKKSLLQSTTDTVFTFVALYVTTLFSLDSWNAARGSPYRASMNSEAFYRPAAPTPSADSYQGRMYNGNRRNDGAPKRNMGGLPNTMDARAPLKMKGPCGTCM
ncbi:hypothetical protein B0J11DRAFT_579198 [Dendryphion nanum]|uniref:Uncharacterized protein n=1 Tax=Dendryphion nanum TaxID=256645 RepID=A0A9P9DYF1_9PLEO|nr:hypothetical protein B0J11DRAFT_579198 [Dendryphion nanum]